MLLAALSTEEVQAIQAVALAGIAAWVAIRTRQIDATARAAETRAVEARRVAHALDERVGDLEANSGIIRHPRPDEDKPPGRGARGS